MERHVTWPFGFAEGYQSLVLPIGLGPQGERSLQELVDGVRRRHLHGVHLLGFSFLSSFNILIVFLFIFFNNL